jgi:hypothetical protein
MHDVFFSKFDVSKQKKHRKLLFIHQEQTILHLAFQKQKGKASKENPSKLVQNSKTLQELQKIKIS